MRYSLLRKLGIREKRFDFFDLFLDLGVSFPDTDLGLIL